MIWFDLLACSCCLPAGWTSLHRAWRQQHELAQYRTDYLRSICVKEANAGEPERSVFISVAACLRTLGLASEGKLVDVGYTGMCAFLVGLPAYFWWP